MYILYEQNGKVDENNYEIKIKINIIKIQFRSFIVIRQKAFN